MQFNSKGKLAKFYMWLPPKDDALPNDLCTYFWGLVGRAFFVFGFGGTFAGVLIFAIVMAAVWIWTHKLVAGSALGMIAIFIFAIWLSVRKKKARSEIFSETKAIIRGKIDAVKNRYCPRIEWR